MRLAAEVIDRLVAEYVAGTPAAELGQRYGIAKSSVLRLLRQADARMRHPRLSATDEARLVALYEAGQARLCRTARPNWSSIRHCPRCRSRRGTRNPAPSTHHQRRGETTIPLFMPTSAAREHGEISVAR
jgi:hypothetical protein